MLNIRAVQEPPTEDIIKSITLILTKDGFSSMVNIIYTLREQQLDLYGPSYASSFMDNVERRMLADLPAVQSTWLRHINDIFAIYLATLRGTSH